MNHTEETKAIVRNEFRKKDAEFLWELKRTAAIKRKLFLEYDLKEIKALKKTEKIIFLKEWYPELVFFPSPEVIERFKQLGLNSYCLRWFVDINQILREFQKIENNADLIILRSGALVFIKLYLKSKIIAELQRCFDLTAELRDNPESPFLAKILTDVYRQKETNHKIGIRYKGLFNFVMHATADQMTDVAKDEKEGKKLALSISKGNSEKFFLKAILNYIHCFSNNCTKRKLYILLFDLFKLVCKDITLHSEEEFVNKEYNTTYSTYKYSRVRHLLGK